MNFHPASLLFPMMSDSELNELAEDIKKSGQIEPVVLYHGEVLDGRNRLKACELAGLEPKFTEANGDVPSPTLYALSKNMHRRHLSPSQKAAIGAEVVPLLEDEAKERQRRGTSVPTGTEVSGRSREIAAKLTDSSESSIGRALAVKKADPKSFENIKSGKVTANAAYDALHGKQRGEIGGQQPTTVITDRGRQLAQADKRRMVDGLATLGGMCAGMEALKIDMIVAVCSTEEINTWATKAETHARELRKFAAKLRGAKNGESTSLQESEG